MTARCNEVRTQIVVLDQPMCSQHETLPYRYVQLVRHSTNRNGDRDLCGMAINVAACFRVDGNLRRPARLCSSNREPATTTPLFASRWMLGFRWHKLYVHDLAEVSRMGICFRRAGDLQRIRSGRSSYSWDI